MKPLKLLVNMRKAWVTSKSNCTVLLIRNGGTYCSRSTQVGIASVRTYPSFMTCNTAINAGYNEVTHINMIMLNFMGDTIDTRSRGRFIKVGERGKDLDINGKEANDFVQLMKQKNISFDPTMHVFSGMFIIYPGDTDAAIKPIIPWMPADERENVAATSSVAPVSTEANLCCVI
jgi:hypothetical protein